jgi:putative ABC transport system permease protein
MIGNYFRFSWRNIGRYRIFSSINIIGLALGITVCMMILNFVMFEKSYDKFFPRYQDIVRVSYTRYIDNEFQYSKVQIFPAVGDALKESIPIIESYTRLFPVTTHVEAVLWIEEDSKRKTFIESSIYAVDSTFLDIFYLPLIEGNPSKALAGEKKLILSESAAIKYFGHTNVLNKTIHWEGMGDWLVTGVFEDLPDNSHMKFDVLVSWMDVYSERSAWNWDGFYTYILLKPKAQLAPTELLAQQVLDEKTKTTNNRVTAKFFFQPLDQIHLNSSLSGEMRPNGNAKVVEALQVVAFVILALALINYINLSIARAIKRYKEVGVRKIIGSTRNQLLTLFFTESFLLNLIAFVIAFVLVLTLSHNLNSLVGKTVNLVILKEPVLFTIASIGSLFLFSLLAGFYPARILSGINPAGVMKGGIGTSRSKGLRKSLLIIQFLITITLVTSTLVINKQISFMQKQELGFELDQSVVIKSLSIAGAEMDSLFINRISLFKNRIKENSGINNATISSNIPGRENEWY